MFICQLEFTNFELQVLNMLCCWVEDPNSEAFKLHIPRIYDYLWIAEDGMKMQVEILPSLRTIFDKGNSKWLFAQDYVTFWSFKKFLVLSFINVEIAKCLVVYETGIIVFAGLWKAFCSHPPNTMKTIEQPAPILHKSTLKSEPFSFYFFLHNLILIRNELERVNG